MKKSIGIVSVVAVVLAISGFGLAEVTEYLQVARKNVSEAVRESIPVDVEIDRMEVLLSKLDKQVKRQKYQVAKGEIALENAQERLEKDHQHCKATLAKMRHLRELQQCKPTPCGHIQVGNYRIAVSEISGALASKLDAYKAQAATLSEKERAVAAQKQAHAALLKKYADWNQQRELLSSRLETLRSRHEAQQAGRDVAGDSSFDSSELNRATQLADDIEARLQVAEKAEALGTGSLDHLLDGATEPPVDVTAEVDRLLGNDVPQMAEKQDR